MGLDRPVSNTDSHITFAWGASDSGPTGTSLYLILKGRAIQVDWGMMQGADSTREDKKIYDFRNTLVPLDDLITHCHIDHVGWLPGQSQNGWFPKSARFFADTFIKDALQYVFKDQFNLQNMLLNKKKSFNQHISDLRKKIALTQDLINYMKWNGYQFTSQVIEVIWEDIGNYGKKDTRRNLGKRSIKNGKVFFKSGKSTQRFEKNIRDLEFVFNTAQKIGNYNPFQGATIAQLEQELINLNLKLEESGWYIADYTWQHFSEEAYKRVLSRIIWVEANERVVLDHTTGLDVIFSPTGHTEGSRYLYFPTEQLLVTGDIGRRKGTPPYQWWWEVPKGKVKNMICETTYGAKKHTRLYQSWYDDLVGYATSTRGDKLFSAISQQKFPEVVVNLINNTPYIVNCFWGLPHCFCNLLAQKRPEVFGCLINNPRVNRVRDISEVKFGTWKNMINVASSWMLLWPANSIAKVLSWDPNSMIFTTNYQGTWSPWYILQNEGVIMADNGDITPYLWTYKHIDCLSGHWDQTDILEMIMLSKPENVYLVHGDKEAKETMKQLLIRKGFKWNIIIPKNGDQYSLTNGKFLNNLLDN